MRTKVRDKQTHWKNEDAIKERYLRICEQMHMPSDLYELTFENAADGLSMSFRKNACHHQINSRAFSTG